MADFLETVGEGWLEGAAPDPEVVTPEPVAEVIQTEAPEPVEAVEQETPEEAEAKREKFNPVLYREAKEERAKRQEAERERDELRARVAAQPKPEAERAPDPYEDPVGYNQYVQSQVKDTEWRLRAEMSGRFAEQKYGKETVEAAVAWAQAEGAKDPTLGQRVQTQASPVEYVVEQYERSRTLQTLSGKSLEDYAKEYAVSQGWIVSQPGAPVGSPIQKPASAPPPASIARAPGKGGVGQVTSDADWSEVKFALG